MKPLTYKNILDILSTLTTEELNREASLIIDEGDRRPVVEFHTGSGCQRACCKGKEPYASQTT